jgi:SAM-dependent methyltransferase
MNANQTLWEQGDFTRIARSMQASGEDLVERLGTRPGLRVLDLGCGDGTTALPAARRGAEVVGIDIARNLVEAGSRRAEAEGLTNVRFVQGDARDLFVEPDAFDQVVSMFGAMFAPDPFAVAREMVRVTRPGGRIIMGNWIPGDPTLVAEILRISSAYSPTPPEGFVSPMTWGVRDHVVERFEAAGVPSAQITCEPDTWVLEIDEPATVFLGEFREYYGPTMNAFAAAEAAGRADDLWQELELLFKEHNSSADPATSTRIAATYLRVTVDV